MNRIQIVLLALCALCLGCGSGIYTTKKQVLKIDQQPCMGGCPQYQAQFYEDGRISYQGIANMPVLGSHTYMIDKRLVASMLAQGQKIRFPKFAKTYPSPPDYPITVLTLVLERKSHTVSLGPNAPATLQELKKTVHAQIMAILVEQPPYKP